MKQTWINTKSKMPVINEIIAFKEGLYTSKGRHMGNGFVEQENGEIDQFDEWKPKGEL